MTRRPRRDSAIDLLLKAFGRLTPRSQGIVLVTLFAFGLILGGIWLYERHRQEQAALPPTIRQPLPGPTGPPQPPVIQSPGSPQMVLGNPSGARADPSNRDDFLLLKPYFALSYNSSRGGPNWVSWRVTAADIAGSSARKQTFDTDATLPPGFKAVTHRDYTGSGFDRGHMCPHSDRDATTESSWATFVMTNIIPQAPDVNQKAWKSLEEYGRDLVRQRNELCVLSGGFGEGGEGLNGPAKTIANGRVTVPAWCWKIIVVVPMGPGDATSRITSATRVIAVLMPNRQGVGEDWRRFICTPAEVEAKTGYRFFNTLPPDVADMLRLKREPGGRP